MPATDLPDLSEPGPGVRAWSRRGWPRRIAAAVAVLLALGAIALVAIALVVVLESAKAPSPGSFYSLPSPLPAGPPGTVIRSEPVADPPAGAQAFRLLYLSCSYTRARTAVSGLLFVPTGPAPAAGRNVVGFTHGTTGVAPGCAPSAIGPAYWGAIDGLARFLAAGDVVVAPDYQRLGTQGPHPYLVGDSEASATLDQVRAARLFPAAHAGRRFVVWGASQGGQAALFTGRLAAS